VFVIVQVSVCPARMVPVAEFDIGGRFCIQSPVKIGVANPVGTDSVTVKLPGPNVTI
jgi:hypothetical protein